MYQAFWYGLTAASRGRIRPPAMTLDQERLLYIVAGLIAFGFLWRRREAIRPALCGTLIGLICAALPLPLLWKGALSPPAEERGAMGVGALLPGVELRRTRPHSLP